MRAENFRASRRDDKSFFFCLQFSSNWCGKFIIMCNNRGVAVGEKYESIGFDARER